MHVAVGEKAARGLTLSQDDVQKYAEITGDYNPLHFDEQFAARTKFKRLVVQRRPNDWGPERAGRHGHAGPWHRVSEPRLEVHSPSVHWGHDHRRSGSCQRSCEQAGRTTQDQGDSPNGRNSFGRSGLVLHVFTGNRGGEVKIGVTSSFSGVLARRTSGMDAGTKHLLASQYFERFFAQDTEAGEPAGSVRKQGRGNDSDGIRQQVELETAVKHTVE